MDQILSMKNVVLTRGEKTILEDLSWSISAGEHWALLGPNGSGKTMTLEIVTASIWPSSGTAALLGKQFGTYDLRKLRREVGLVSYGLQFAFSERGDTALEVVLSGCFNTFGIYDVRPTEEQVKKARSLLWMLDCEPLAHRFFRTLSHGEQKRAIIARALMTDPKLLVLDEPCTGLDLAGREQFLETVSNLARQQQQLSTIFVTHHSEEILPYITHAMMLRNGKCLCQGPKHDVLTAQNLKALFDLEVEITETDGRFWTTIAARV